MPRTTRAASSLHKDTANFSTREKLLFAQAVYEYGTSSDAWDNVAKALAEHPLLHRSKNFFSVSNCQAIYAQLLQDAGLERPQATLKAKDNMNLNLARVFYVPHMQELKSLVLAEETKYKQLAREIREIKNGEWDNRGERSPQSPHDYRIQDIQEMHKQSSRPVDSLKQIGQNGPQDEVTTSSGDVQTSPKERVSPQRSASPMATRNPRKRATKDKTKTVATRQSSRRKSEVASPSSPAALSPDPRDVSRQTLSPIADDSPSPSRSRPTLEVRMPRPQSPDPDKPTSVTSPSSQNVDISSRKRKVPGTPEHGNDLASKKARTESEIADDSNEDPPDADDDVASPLTIKRLQGMLLMLHGQISQNRSGSIFHNPIRESEAPDYHEIVKRPIDLKTIKAKVKDGHITSSAEFQRDILLMFANAMMYNKPDTDIFKMAEEMMLEAQELMQDFRNNENVQFRPRRHD